MRAFTKKTALLLAAVLMLSLLTGTALADVTKVKALGDGSMEVRWDDTDAEELILVPDMGGGYDADKETFGTIPWMWKEKAKSCFTGWRPASPIGC